MQMRIKAKERCSRQLVTAKLAESKVANAAIAQHFEKRLLASKIGCVSSNIKQSNDEPTHMQAVLAIANCFSGPNSSLLAAERGLSIEI